jgi:hypothetical protein
VERRVESRSGLGWGRVLSRTPGSDMIDSEKKSLRVAPKDDGLMDIVQVFAKHVSIPPKPPYHTLINLPRVCCAPRRGQTVASVVLGYRKHDVNTLSLGTPPLLQGSPDCPILKHGLQPGWWK